MRFSYTLSLAAATIFLPAALPAQKTITGQAAFADWNQQQPGIRRKITLADLPQPNPDEAVNNTPHVIPAPRRRMAHRARRLQGHALCRRRHRSHAARRQQASWPSAAAPSPCRASSAPRPMAISSSPTPAPESIFVLRGVGPDGKAAQIEKFATGLDHPFGIAFYPADNPKYVYVGNATTVQRFPYHSGDLHATGPAETIVPDIPGYAQLTGGGHWTRDVVFTKDGQHMLVSVGSGSNVDDADTHPREFHRADVLEYTPEGKFVEVYAHGIRNCVGEAINPTTGQLWCSTNERDNLGNHLVPDYVTSVKEGGFFGWPWYYMGGHQDPRLPQPCANGTGPNPQAARAHRGAGDNCKRVDLSSKVITPDVLVQPHMASLEMAFYPSAGEFPASMTATPSPPSTAPGTAPTAPATRSSTSPCTTATPTAVTKTSSPASSPKTARSGAARRRRRRQDGSLFVTDDGSRSVWHVTYVGK